MSGCADLERSVPGGYVGDVPTATCKSRMSVLFDAHICNVEGCGLIADVPNLLIN